MRQYESGNRWSRSGKQTPRTPIHTLQTSEVCFFEGFLLLCLTVISPASKLSEVRLRLAEEEISEAERGQHMPHKVSASVFIRTGLELEEQQ